jgi:hypothetical protein
MYDLLYSIAAIHQAWDETHPAGAILNGNESKELKTNVCFFT